VIRAAWFGGGLPAPPARGRRPHHWPPYPMPCLTDPLRATGVARLVRRRRQTDDRPHLPAIGELPPAEQLVHQQPRARQAHARQFQQPTQPLDVRRVVAAKPLRAFVLQFLELLIGQLPAGEPARPPWPPA